MKEILGHCSWNKEEILAFFDKGGFTMCSLPHYRYARVQQICAELKSMGYISKAGSTETSTNYVPTELYKQWRNLGGDLSYTKYYKSLNPRKEKTKKCVECGVEFKTINYQQKRCSSACMPVKVFATKTEEK